MITEAWHTFNLLIVGHKCVKVFDISLLVSSKIIWYKPTSIILCLFI